MARRKSSNSKTPGLGMGLDALIKAKTRDENSQSGTEEVDAKEPIATTNLENSDESAVPTSMDSEKSIKGKSSKKKSPKSKPSKNKPQTSKKSADSSDKNSSADTKFGSNNSLEDNKINTVTLDVKKNPRITLWSSRSAAVLRYLKKTQPEFSISKEASKLIEDAVKEKYPEIWDLFDDL